MGNCCASTVDNHSSPSAAKPSTPDDNEEALKMSKRNNNSTTAAATENRTAAGTGGAEEVPPSGRVITPNLKIFTFSELKSATRNFRQNAMVGDGGFERVFKGWVDEKTYAPSRIGVGLAIAVKQSNPDNPQELEQWQDFNAKLSNFGLARLGLENGNSHVTTRVMGTCGYVAPEYIATGHEKCFENQHHRTDCRCCRRRRSHPVQTTNIIVLRRINSVMVMIGLRFTTIGTVEMAVEAEEVEPARPCLDLTADYMHD